MMAASTALAKPSSRLALSFRHSNKAPRPPLFAGFPGESHSGLGGTEVGLRLR
jgi:hypothetical protein